MLLSGNSSKLFTSILELLLPTEAEGVVSERREEEEEERKRREEERGEEKRGREN